MAHKKFIDSVMKHGQVTIKDLDEFLRFTLCDYDMRTIDDNYMQSCRDSRSSTKRLTELPLKGAGKTLFLTAARTRRKKFEYQPLRTLQGAFLAENHKQATETQYHCNRSLQRDAGHTSHHHEKK